MNIHSTDLLKGFPVLDLYVAIAGIWLLSVLIFVVVRRQSRGLSRTARTVTLTFVLLLCISYVVFLRDNVVLARILPFSGLPVLANWLPLFCALVAALAWRAEEQRVARRIWPAWALGCVGVYATVHPILGEPPACRDSWQGNVCLQSSWYSCSAACAATLLRRHDIAATEQEMAELCLTRQGTTWQGLFRGLKQKTAGGEWDVEVVAQTVEELSGQTGPTIISVGILNAADVDPIYTQQYGWPPGQLHSVVLLEFSDEGQPKIADPSVGTEHWSAEDLRVLYRGVGLRLSRR